MTTSTRVIVLSIATAMLGFAAWYIGNAGDPVIAIAPALGAVLCLMGVFGALNRD
jgi:hypothetical protein